MEVLKKKRKVIRFQVTRFTNDADKLLSSTSAIDLDECYGDAIDILQKSFGDSSALIQDHMQGLIDISPVSSEKNVRDLRRMLDSVQVHMRDLNALGVGEESYERPPLRHLLGLFEIELESRERTLDDRPG
ncbi:hypothetical protein HPB50_017621 [Hyalomma asiaticum]|uniref:Uncharacterized protein n=1 Tax=Hyalomma asiaticum TaxID=266040 RepID=A0ACB7RPM4_HYAAI|nr:hypothetical protein HPB50_017621 [Hyalomma asiaticum]